MLRQVLMLGALIAVASGTASAQATVRVETAHLEGPRQLQEQTQAAVIRNYLQAWQSIRIALDQNRVDLLDGGFAGTAREKLADTIQQQAALGIHTRYEDKAHDLQIVFYSPDGLSIQLMDDVEYDVQVLEGEKLETTQHVRARYVAVLTPAEVRWRVRVLQAQSE